VVTIREIQLQAFEEIERVRFENRMVSEIAAGHPETYEAWGETLTRQFVQRAIEKGIGFGFRAESAFSGLIELMIEYGEELELAPERGWVREMLMHPSLPDFLKISMIRDRLAARTQGRKIVRVRAGGSDQDSAAGPSRS
jgi:hypothetical protein